MYKETANESACDSPALSRNHMMELDTIFETQSHGAASLNSDNDHGRGYVGKGRKTDVIQSDEMLLAPYT